MHSQLLLALSLLTSTASAETILGAYIYARHGDRTAKATPPSNLTTLGYSEAYMTGQYYHNRYISENSDTRVFGIDPTVYNAAQLAASAPSDEVLQNSATGFLQALYPPAGNAMTATLRNGSKIDAPMQGYQLIPLETVDQGSNSENTGWLQSTGNCYKATVSSNNYFLSTQYQDLLKSTADFYKSLTPMLDRVFDDSKISYKNAYTIWDYLNVANIHNQSWPSDDLLTDETFKQLHQLANTHEFNLAYNESDTIRAVAGSVLAGEILSSLKETIDTAGKKTKLDIQFGNYATFQSFFGLSGLPSVNVDFTGVPDYASSMAFELVTNATVSDTSFPDVSDISVRFLFHNGSLIPDSADSQLAEYPLFKQSETVLPWSDFESQMKKIAISDQKEWCSACGNSTGICASSGDPTSSTNSGNDSNNSSGGGMSRAVAGVIGAMVTLGVILGLEVLAMLAGGFRLVKKNRLNGSVPAVSEANKV